jgi:hypothetical protein
MASRVGGERPQEYVAVVMMVNHYAAVHVINNKKHFKSEHPEMDQRVAAQAARVFAESHHIPYLETLQLLDRAVYTVVKEGEKWYPAGFDSVRFFLLKDFGGVDIGGSQEDALHFSRSIAMAEGSDCLPEIGISLSNK